MANIVELKDGSGVKSYPITKAQAVYDSNGSTVEQDIATDKADIASLKSQVASFNKLEAGSTTGDAELINARTTWYGTTEANAGTAIRNQSENLILAQSGKPTGEALKANKLWVKPSSEDIELAEMKDLDALNSAFKNSIDDINNEIDNSKGYLTEFVEKVSKKTYNILPYEPSGIKINDVLVFYYNGTISVKGTANGSGGRLDKLTQMTLEAGDYYFYAQNNSLFGLYIENVNDNSIIASLSPSGITTFRLANTTNVFIGVSVKAGVTYDEKFNVMIKTGTDIRTWIAPVDGLDYSNAEESFEEKIVTELTKNLATLNNGSKTWNGVTATLYKKENKIVFNGKATSSGDANVQLGTVLLYAGTYYLTAIIDESQRVNIGIKKANGNIAIRYNSGPFTISETTEVYICAQVINGINYDSSTAYVQIESSPSESWFVPHLTSVDYIARNGISEITHSLEENHVLEITIDKTKLRDLSVKSALENNIEIINELNVLYDDETYNNTVRPVSVWLIKDGVKTAIVNNADDGGAVELTSGWIGAGHGYNRGNKITLRNHGKTFADIGSVWQTPNGNKWYIVKIIDGDNFVMLGEASEDNEYDTIPITNETLTHVSGAIHTDIIADYTNSAYQLEPLTMSGQVKKILLDGTKNVYEDGIYYADSVDIINHYTIVKPNSIVGELIANRPSGGYTSNPSLNNGEKFLEIDNVYRILYDGSMVIFRNIFNHVKVQYNFVQVTQNAQDVAVSTFGGNCYKYIPDVKPQIINGTAVDPRTPINMDGWSSILNTPVASWQDFNYPPDRVITLYTDDKNEYKVGYAVGLVPIADGAPEIRKENTTNPLYLFSSKKTYLGFFNRYGATSGIVEENTNLEAVAYRTPILDISNLHTDVYMIECGEKCYVYCDYHKTGVDTIDIPKKYIGKEINVLHRTDGIIVFNNYAIASIKVICSKVNPNATAVIEIG